MRNPKLIDKFTRNLSAPARHLVQHLLRRADERGLAIYLVGGPLRDLLLGHPSLDVDIAVEGDAMALARELAEGAAPENKARSARPQALVGRAAATTSELRVITHSRFGTATVRLDRFHLDVITARSETYPRPGALPTVKPATIREDLLRRDFTISALALYLNGPHRGEILDPSGGLADLDAGLIRALHERSFQDDATRILRAVRYAARLGFQIESETLAWIKRDLSYLNTISGTRLHHEFARILAEDAPEDTLSALAGAGVLALLHPAFSFDEEYAAAFSHLRELNPTGARAAYWPVLAWRLSEAQAADLSRRLALTHPQRAAVEAMPALQQLVSRRDAPQARLGGSRAAGDDAPKARLSTAPRLPAERSAVAELLAPFPLPALWATAALTDDPALRGRLLDYLTKARHERPHLTGDDLLALGIRPGPQLGEILRHLHTAKLDREVSTRQDEERLVERLLAGKSAKSTPLPARPEALEG